MKTISAVLVLTICACGRGDQTPKFKPAGHKGPRDGGTLHIAASDRVATLDPAQANDETSTYVVHAMFDTLMDYAPGSVELVPRLANSVSISSDRLTYVFTTKVAAFSDGTPMRAADIAAALERARGDSPYADYVKNIDSVSAAGDHVLSIKLKEPSATFLYVLAMPFTAPVHDGHGVGPFKLDAWEQGETLRLVKTPDYYDPSRVHLDAIELRENVPDDTAFHLFLRGDLDVIDHLTTPDVQWVLGEDAWAPYVMKRASLESFGYQMDTSKKPFDDPRVRRALNYAHDKAHVVKLMSGLAVPSHGMLPPGVLGRDDELAPFEHDVAMATSLLEDAGYGNGLEIELTTSDDDVAVRLAAALQADLKEVGVTLKINAVSQAALVTAISGTSPPPLVLLPWQGDTPDPSSYLERARGLDDEIDQGLDLAGGQPDPKKRAGLYKQIERLVRDLAPWIFDYHRLRVAVKQPYVADYDIHPMWARDLASVWLDVDDDGEPVKR